MTELPAADGGFGRSARLYDVMYEAKDYGAAAAEIHARIQRLHPGARDLLDVACGTGRHLERLQHDYRVEGLDISAELLEQARARAPGVPFHEADMTDFSLGRSFDVVTCLFSAIAYVRTPDMLHRAVAAMARHLRSPGLLLVEPWFTPETYWPDHVAANFHDAHDVKLAWMYRHDRRDRLSILDIHYLVGDHNGVEHFVERQELGLFTREEIDGALESAGLEPRDASGLFGRGLHIGVRASG